MAQYQSFAEIYDELMYDCDYEQWSQYLLGLLREGGIASGSGIDFACGSGRITEKLLKAGYSVTGVDVSAPMLSLAVQRCSRYARRALFAEGDMASFRAGKPCDFITCACDGVNYLEPSAQFPKFLKNCARSLKEGGMLLFDVSSEYKLTEILGDNLFGDDTEKAAYLWQNRQEKEYVEMDLIFFVKRGEVYEKFCERHRMYRYPVSYVEGELRAAGFSEVAAYGFLTRRPPLPEERRVQFAAVKE